jgi:regulation of enolase protein 1 (concanavalin A-like superfamily)
LRWLNVPRQWSVADDVLTVTADPDTDFWRTTHYGYVTDTGHVYGADMSGDFDLRVLVRGAYAEQYDQAGAMIRVDDQYWLKTGIEFVDGRARFSTVVTLGYSSWAVAELPAGCTEVGLWLARRGDSVEVRYLAGSQSDSADAMNLAAIAYLPPGRPVLAGAMCAAPTGRGFTVSFHDLSVRPAD